MATPISLLLLPPQTLPKPNYSISTLKLRNSRLHSNNLRWNSPALAQKWPRIGGRTPVRAATGEIAPPSEVTLEKAQEIVPAASSNDGIVSSVISVLLFAAFIALSILTIGVIYLAVQDFLQKREREKFEKEEAERKKKDKKKKRRKGMVVPGPKGFTLSGRGLDGDDD